MVTATAVAVEEKGRPLSCSGGGSSRAAPISQLRSAPKGHNGAFVGAGTGDAGGARLCIFDGLADGAGDAGGARLRVCGGLAPTRKVCACSTCPHWSPSSPQPLPAPGPRIPPPHADRGVGANSRALSRRLTAQHYNAWSCAIPSTERRARSLSAAARASPVRAAPVAVEAAAGRRPHHAGRRVGEGGIGGDTVAVVSDLRRRRRRRWRRPCCWTVAVARQQQQWRRQGKGVRHAAHAAE
eukprot:COSAG01_NODE_4113_length_5338_cov_9.585226_3_plen_240_part_00